MGVKYAKNKATIQRVIAEADGYLEDPRTAALVNSVSKISNPIPYKPRRVDYYMMNRICGKEDIILTDFIDRAVKNEINRTLGINLPAIRKEKQWFQSLMPLKNWLIRKIKQKPLLRG